MTFWTSLYGTETSLPNYENRAKIVIWPEDSIAEAASTTPRFTPTTVLTGRTQANVIRSRFRPDQETTTHITDAASAMFSASGFNVLVIGNDRAPTKDTILYPYNTAVRNGFSGWSGINTWWESLIDALFGAGHRLDALMLDFENGIFGTDYGNIPDGAGGDGESVVAHMRGTVLPLGNYEELPSGPDYDVYKTASTSSAAFYAQRKLFNDAVMALVREQIKTNMLDVIWGYNADCIVSAYDVNSYINNWPNRTNSSVNDPSATIYGASSPECYYGLDDTHRLISNITAPVYPWLTPTTFDSYSTRDKEWASAVELAEDMGCTIVNLWASNVTFAARQDTPTIPETPVAAYDMQDTSGSTYTDSVSSNDGTLLGNNSINANMRKGPGGYYWLGAQFDGINNRVSLPGQPSTVYSPATFSIACWLYADESSATDRLAIGADSTNRRSISYASGALRGRAGTAAYFGSVAMSAGEWHHVCLTGDSGTGDCHLWVDGVDEATINTGTLANAANVFIGQSGNGGAYWKGRIAGVVFDNVAYDSDQVNALYDLGKPVFWEDAGIQKLGPRLCATFRGSELRYTFQWYLNGIEINGATSAIWYPLFTGDYSVTVTLVGDFGTASSTSDSLFVEVNTSSAGYARPRVPSGMMTSEVADNYAIPAVRLNYAKII